MIFAGVDAGGSHCEAVIGVESGEQLARCQGPPASVTNGPIQTAADAITATVRRALTQATVDEPVASLVIGAAGTGISQHRSALHAAVARHAIARNLEVTSDADIALESAFPDEPGILLVAGTGSIAFARAPGGEVRRVGGFGWKFGDEGSSYSLARAAIVAVLRASDGRGPQTELTELLREATDTASETDFRQWLDGAGVADVAALAQFVCSAAEGGNTVATSLVLEAGRSLADHVIALLSHFEGGETVNVALHGGMMQSDCAVRHSMSAELERRAPRASVSNIRVDPAMGALSLAIGLTRD